MAATTLQVRAKLRIRQGAPNSSATIAGTLDPGTVVTALDEIAGETVAGNAQWYQLDGDRYIWSGGVVPIAAAPPAAADLPVQTYPNGKIRVLSDAQIHNLYGAFAFQESSPRGAVKPDPAWANANLVTIDMPTLAAVNHPRLTVNTHAADPFRRVFARIEAAGLTDRILTCGGTYVARHKTWNPARTLSSHSWGIAIDLNVAWNGYGVVPPAVGAVGSVRELIPHFAAEGFGWGGDFSEADGMHFELAVTKF